MSVDPQIEGVDSELKSTALPDYGIKMTARLDAGVTGRNGLLSVAVNGKTYEEMLWTESGGDMKSDFPVFIPVDNTEHRAFLRIRVDGDNVVVDECRQK